MRLFLLLVSLSLNAAQVTEPTPQQRYHQALKYLSHSPTTIYNPEQARLMLEENCKLGHRPSMRLLSTLYLTGTGGVKNIAYSMGWLGYLSSQGDHLADAELARRFTRGVGIEPNERNADFFAARAAQNHDIARIARPQPQTPILGHTATLKRSNSAPKILTKKRLPIQLPTLDISLPLASYDYKIISTVTHKKPAEKPTKTATIITEKKVGPETDQEKIYRAKNLILDLDDEEQRSQGIELLKSIVSPSKEVYVLLAKAYVKKAFKISRPMAPKIYEQLFALAANGGDYPTVKECFSWSMWGKQGLEPNITDAEKLVSLLEPKEQKKAYKNIALLHAKNSRFTKSCKNWEALQKLSKEKDHLYFEASMELAACYVHKNYQASNDVAAQWLETYYDRRHTAKNLLSNEELGDYLRALGVSLYNNEKDKTALPLRLLEKAHNLQNLKATVDYVKLLFITKNPVSALKIAHSFLPPEQVAQCYQQINQSPFQPPNNTSKELKQLAFVVAKNHIPEKIDMHNDTYSNYMSYAALNGKKSARVDVGYYMLFGYRGFNKNPARGIELLTEIPPQHSLYPDTMMALTEYYLSVDDYEKATTYYLQLFEHAIREYVTKFIGFSEKFILAKKYELVTTGIQKLLNKKNYDIFPQKSPPWVQLHILLGHSQLMSNNYEKALKSFTVAADAGSPLAIYNVFIMENIILKPKRNAINIGSIISLLLNKPDVFDQDLVSPYAISPFFQASNKRATYVARANELKSVVDLNSMSLNNGTLINADLISLQPLMDHAIRILEREARAQRQLNLTAEQQLILKDMDDALTLLKMNVLGQQPKS